MPMRKTTKVLALTSLALLTTNIIMGTSYVIDKQHLEEEIFYQTTEADYYKKKQVTDFNEYQKIMDGLGRVIEEKQTEVHNLQKQLENAQTRNEAPSVSLEMEVTAYTAGYESTQKQKGDNGYGITASGTYVKEGRTIACPPSLEFGTKLNIEGIGLRVCEDRGGAIKDGHLDLYMNSVTAALEFGRRTLSVEILNQEG
jgi:3D (Asp-Asp-Asp) domain-containing protein